MPKSNINYPAIQRRVVFAYILICLFMWAFQRNLIYVPTKHIAAPEAYGLNDFESLRLTSEDGTHVLAWYHKASDGYPTIIYYHGNGGNLAGRKNYFRQLADAGFGVLGLDYRGYGTSEGSPTEMGLYQDARATMDYAIKTLSLARNQIIIYGESLGTGVAVEIASEYRSGGLILQSPFTSMEEVAKYTYPWLPVHCLLKDRFDSIVKIANVHVPLLLFHGQRDKVVPIEEGKTLFDYASKPKEAIYYPKNGHEDFDTQILTDALVAFCNKYNLIHAISEEIPLQKEQSRSISNE